MKWRELQYEPKRILCINRTQSFWDLTTVDFVYDLRSLDLQWPLPCAPFPGYKSKSVRDTMFMHVTKCIYEKKQKINSVFKYGSVVEIHNDFFKEASEESVRHRKLKKLLRRSYGIFVGWRVSRREWNLRWEGSVLVCSSFLWEMVIDFVWHLSKERCLSRTDTCWLDHACLCRVCTTRTQQVILVKRKQNFKSVLSCDACSTSFEAYILKYAAFRCTLWDDQMTGNRALFYFGTNPQIISTFKILTIGWM